MTTAQLTLNAGTEEVQGLTVVQKRAGRRIESHYLVEYPECRCELRPGMTRDELLELGAGCTAGRCVCPVLDTYRRLLGGWR